VLVSRFGRLSSERGHPGQRVTLHRPTGRDENWFWTRFDSIDPWWSRTRIGVPEETSTQHLLASMDPGTRCSFKASFREGAAPQGRYLITVIGYYQGGFGIMEGRSFVVHRGVIPQKGSSRPFGSTEREPGRLPRSHLLR